MARKDRYANPTMGFAWMRLICAAVVILDHSGSVGQGWGTPIVPGNWGIAPGNIVLMVVFAMSGYQISGSWERDPSWWRFAARRLLRILPPLMFLLMVTVFVIGPLVTTWTQADYWAHPQTWRYLVGGFVLFLLQHNLPGVFYDNPYPWSANGSLWTLPMEVMGYGIVLIVGLVIGLIAAVKVPRLVILAPLLAGMYALDAWFHADIVGGGGGGSWLQVPLGPLVSFLVPFVLGMVLYFERARIPLLRVPALLLVVAWFLLRHEQEARYLLPLASAYGVIVAAHHWPKWLGGGRWAKGSYGMYLWGFLVQQLIVMTGVTDPWLLGACAVPVAYLCGVLSWNYVEQPTQRLRRHLRRASPARSPGRELVPQ